MLNIEIDIKIINGLQFVAQCSIFSDKNEICKPAISVTSTNAINPMAFRRTDNKFFFISSAKNIKYFCIYAITKYMVTHKIIKDGKNQGKYTMSSAPVCF